MKQPSSPQIETALVSGQGNTALSRLLRWRWALATLVLMASNPAPAQFLSTESSARGWDIPSNAPITNYDSSQFSTVAAYAAAGYVIRSEAVADAQEFAAPFSRSRAFSSLDQSDPANGVLRQFSESRAVYFPDSSNPYPVSSITSIKLNYNLQVENLSGTPLNIVFGNHIQGLMATYLEGQLAMIERTKIGDFDPFSGTVTVGEGVSSSSGGWRNAVFSDTYADPYLGQIPAFRLNSFQFYGSRSFAAGESATIPVSHEFILGTFLNEFRFSNGIAVGDFTGTADLTIRAYDSFGVDRTSEISLTMAVPEPMTMAGLAVGVALLSRRRKGR